MQALTLLGCVAIRVMGVVMMWMLAGLALATEPAWNNGRVTVPVGVNFDTVLRTPSGDVAVGHVGAIPTREQIDAGGVPHQTPMASAPFGRFVSTHRPCDLDGDGVDEWVDVVPGPLLGVHLRDLYTGAVRVELQTASSMEPDSLSFECADLDANGTPEFLLHMWERGFPIHTSTHVWDHTGVLLHTELGTVLDVSDAVTAQLDTDPALEVVLHDKRIVDGASWLDQGTLVSTNDAPRMFDMDGDGLDEWVSSTTHGVALWGANRQRHWSASLPATPNAMFLGDLDGDGAAEVVAHTPQGDSGVWTTFDAQTGAVRATTHGPGCDEWFRFDHDGDGIAGLVCRASRTNIHALLGADGTVQSFRGQGAATQPLVGDLDGDGAAEVVWWERRADRLVVRDPQGNWLGHAQVSLPSSAILADLDGDGDDEILHGVHAYDYAPGAGLVSLPPILQTASAAHICPLGLADMNHDGFDELLYEDCLNPRAVYMLDLGGGAIVDVPGTINLEPPTYADLNADGSAEIVINATVSQVSVLNETGREIARAPGLAWDVLEHRGRAHLVTVGGRSGRNVHVYRWRGPALEQVQRWTAPFAIQSHLRALGGRVWWADGDLKGWSPVDGSVLTYDMPDAEESRFTLAGGLLWVGGPQHIFGIPLP